MSLRVISESLIALIVSEKAVEMSEWIGIPSSSLKSIWTSL